MSVTTFYKRPESKPRRAKYFSTGPAPRTPRGKRRHAARSDEQKAHAKSVWKGEGGTFK